MARPTRFSREDILEKAMQAFWNEGYSATGMADLVNITDLKPGSLYAAFNSKRDLFLASLDHYGQRSVANIEQALNASDSPLDDIRRFFSRQARDAAGDKGKRSCFLVNTVLELARHDDEIRERVNIYFKQIETLFQRRLKQAQACGELSTDKDPKMLAAFLLNNIWGLRVLGGTAPSAKRAQDIVKLVLSVLD
jgi:TetR/AcrR family transcriptional repressor of nem operon